MLVSKKHSCPDLISPLTALVLPLFNRFFSFFRSASSRPVSHCSIISSKVHDELPRSLIVSDPCSATQSPFVRPVPIRILGKGILLR
ncbi:hypothetical protein AcV7_009775 [Taiwanofungus camphoratus]|nr:hypothetical protein AcW2_007369 [Antrodia cinnamomea]KAI0947321.1 hypothetical protein AcV7_009775 [Antrodia cinnamomea]